MNETIYTAFEKLLGSHNIDVKHDHPILSPSGKTTIPDIIRIAQEHKYKIRINGKETFPTPEKMPKVIYLSTTGLSNIREVNPEDFVVVAEAGTLVDNVTTEVERCGLSLPLDNTSGSESTIGGAYMTGAVGPSAVGYGLFRTAVIGAQCITSSGDSVSFGGRTVKNVTGYDVPWFLWGTQGLFALACELTIKLRPLPETRIVVEGRLRDGSYLSRTLDSIVRWRNNVSLCEVIAESGLGNPIEVSIGFEGMDSIVRRSVEHLGNDLSALGVENVQSVTYAHFTKHRREIAKKFAGTHLVTISIPPSSTRVFLETILDIYSTLPVLAHALLGRIHVITDNDATLKTLEKLSLALGGKRPVQWGEIPHAGISCLLSGTEYDIAKRLKRELDPDGMFNPDWGL